MSLISYIKIQELFWENSENVEKCWIRTWSRFAPKSNRFSPDPKHVLPPSFVEIHPIVVWVILGTNKSINNRDTGEHITHIIHLNWLWTAALWLADFSLVDPKMRGCTAGPQRAKEEEQPHPPSIWTHVRGSAIFVCVSVWTWRLPGCRQTLTV